MKPEGSLPRLQKAATCPYPDADQSSPRPTTHLLKIHLNIILPSMPGSSKWFLSLRFPHQDPICTYPAPHTWYKPRPSHHLDLITGIIYGEEYRSRSSSLCSFSPLPCYLVPLRPKYSPKHPILKHPQPTLLPQCERPSFTPIQNNRQNYSSVYLNIYICG